MSEDEGPRAKITYTVVPDAAPALGAFTCYIGIDPSLTGYGVVVLLPNGVAHAWQYSPKGKEIERLVYFEGWFKHFLDLYTHHAFSLGGVAMEGYSYGSQNSHAHALGEIGGLTKLLLARRFGVNHPALRSLILPPSTVKKFVTGKGNAPKDIMRLEVYKRWGVSFSTTDMTDAYALARAAQVIHGGAPDKRAEFLPCFAPASGPPRVRRVSRPSSVGLPPSPG